MEKSLFSKLSVVVLLFFSPFMRVQAESQIQASSDSEVAELPQSIQEKASETYFLAAEKPGMLLGILEFPAYSFYLGAPDINGVAYVPNFSPRLGSQVRWKNLGLIFTFGLPLPPEEQERRGKTEQANFVISRYWREYGLDLYFQDYRGFYVASPITELDINKPDRYPQLPDAVIKNYGLNFYKSMDPTRYSLSAAFNQMEIQVLGGGSWITTLFYNHLEMSAGDIFVPGTDPNAIQTLPNLHTGIFDTLGAGGGYGYTWVSNGFYLSAQGILGLGVQSQKIDQSQGDLDKTLSPAFKGNLNFSAGWNEQEMVFGGKVLMDSLFSNVRDVQVYSTLLNGQLFFGWRF